MTAPAPRVDSPALELIVLASPNLEDVGSRERLGDAVRIVGSSAEVSLDGTMLLDDPAIPSAGLVVVPGVPGATSLPTPAGGASSAYVGVIPVPWGSTVTVTAGSVLRLGDSLVTVTGPIEEEVALVTRASTSDTGWMPSAAELASHLDASDDFLRVRTCADESFLVIRLGTAEVIDDDGSRSVVPLTLDLRQHRVVRITGDTDAAWAVIRAIAVQLTALRRLDELALLRVAPDPGDGEADVLARELPWLAEMAMPVGRPGAEASGADDPLAVAEHDAFVTRDRIGPEAHTVMIVAAPPHSGGRRPDTVAELAERARLVPGSTVLVVGDAPPSQDDDLVVTVGAGCRYLSLHRAGDPSAGVDPIVVAWPEGLALSACRADRPDAPPPWADEDGDQDGRADRISVGRGPDVPIGAGQHLLLLGASGQGKSVTLTSIASEISSRADELGARLILIDLHKSVFDPFGRPVDGSSSFIDAAPGVEDVIGADPSLSRMHRVRHITNGILRLLEFDHDEPVVIVIDELAWTLDTAEVGRELGHALRQVLTHGAQRGLQLIAATQVASESEAVDLRPLFPSCIAFWSPAVDEVLDLMGEAVPDRTPGHALISVSRGGAERLQTIDPGRPAPALSSMPTARRLGPLIPPDSPLPPQPSSPPGEVRLAIGHREDRAPLAGAPSTAAMRSDVDPGTWTLVLTPSRPIVLFAGTPRATAPALAAVVAALRAGGHDPEDLTPELSPISLEVLEAVAGRRDGAFPFIVAATIDDVALDALAGGAEPRAFVVAGVDASALRGLGSRARAIVADPLAEGLNRSLWLDDGHPAAIATGVAASGAVT